MRILVIALGSRGDVQPYVALGKGLLAAGHTVRLMTHDNFERLVAAHGLEFWPARGNVEEIAQSPEMRELVEKGKMVAMMRQTAGAAQEAARLWARDGLEAAQRMELIVAGMGGLFTGLALAEKLDLPLVPAYLVPFTPTAAFPGVLVPGGFPGLGGAFNRLSHRLTQQMIWQGVRAADKGARQQVLELPAAPFWGPFGSERLRQGPLLYGFSPAVISKPADWDENVHITGYWFLEEAAGWSPPAELLAFLEKGPAPLYIGFGSMSSRKPEETTALVLAALAETGQRAVLLSGWGGLRRENLPESVFMVDSIPHSWLLPRMAAVVHHGGAGTTAAGLRAGVPSFITPFFGDQPFWGQRVAEAGVGPEPIARKRLTAGGLAQAIRQMVSNEGMQRRAAALGARIRAEEGVARAVAVIEGVGE